MKGRGASWNPQNRFEKLAYVRDDEAELDENAPRTLYLRDPITMAALKPRLSTLPIASCSFVFIRG